MKKMISLILSAALLLSVLPVGALAQSQVNLNAQSGGLLISEAGTYTLTGSLRGTVWVDPKAGDVTLIMDNMTIDGGEGAGIAAVSGDSLTVILASGTTNRVQDGGNDSRYPAAIYCAVPTRFEGDGRLDVTGNNQMGIQGQKADLTFADGEYFIQGKTAGVKTDGRLTVLNAQVMDMNAQQLLAATPQMVVETGNSGKLNLRQEPDKSSSMIEQFSNGTAVTVLQNQGDWSRVEVNGKTGYMMNQYLTPIKGQTVESISSDPSAAPQQEAEAPAMPEAPANSTAEEEAPAVPEQAMNPGKGNTPPQTPSGANDAWHGRDGQLPGGMMPEGGQSVEYASTPGEIVASTAVNDAGELEADMENAEYITMTNENNQVKISESGTYVVTGASDDGNITVKKGVTGVVLVLDDLDLTSTSGATVSVNKEAQVKIIISGNVTLTDSENPDDENSADEAVADAFDGAAMKFKANSQVFMTGDGTLTINGSAKNGIKTGDDSSLMIDGGVTINITAASDGINGNYDVTLLDGNFTITAGDDAIHADHILTIGSAAGSGPAIQVTGCNEGLEGTVVNVLGGDIAIRAVDDAINAANGDGVYEGELDYSFNMTGGKIHLTSENGDGIDSNGNVNLIGGEADISSVYIGGDAGIDYDGQMYVSDEFELSNQSGVAGPDGMPGGMGGGQGFMPGMTDGQGNSPFGGNGGPMGDPRGNGQQNDAQGQQENGNIPARPDWNNGQPPTPPDQNGEMPTPPFEQQELTQPPQSDE